MCIGSMRLDSEFSSDDPRHAEMELLQAMYTEEEPQLLPGEGFAFVLRLSMAETVHVVELTVQLPEAYPAILPDFRISCDSVTRAGIDQLTQGLAAKMSLCVGELCVTDAVEWLVEHTPKHLVIEDVYPSAPVSPSEICTEETPMVGCIIREGRGDLFEVGLEWSLCHCVSKDLEMGAGIATGFKKQFGGVEELKRQHVQVGGVGVLQKKGRYIYYLVTKNKHGGKPSLTTLEASLRAMKAEVSKAGVKKIAMPKIGCGLDKLSWGAVSEVISGVFSDCDIEILVKSL